VTGQSGCAERRDAVTGVWGRRHRSAAWAANLDPPNLSSRRQQQALTQQIQFPSPIHLPLNRERHVNPIFSSWTGS
jgi:hypothetical protein